MIGRVIIIVVVNAIFMIGVLWYLPIQGLLQARGYAPERIAAVTEALNAQPETEQAPAGAAPASSPGTPSGEPEAGQPGDGAPSNGDSGQDQAGTDDAAPQSASSQPESEPEPRAELVATDVVNVRSGQSTDAEIVGRIPNGTTVEVVTDPGGDWVEIDYGEGTGWVYRPLFEQPAE